jgi:hypothetical protein
MPYYNPKKRRKRSRKQQNSTRQAHNQANQKLREPLAEKPQNLLLESPRRLILRLEDTVKQQERVLVAGKQRWKNERRRNIRLKKANAMQKLDLKKAHEDAYQMRGALAMMGKRVDEMQKVADDSIQHLHNRILELQVTAKNLNRQKAVLSKRCKRLQAAKYALKERMKKAMKNYPATFRMMHKGRYTPAARFLARLMVSAGAAEAKVGDTLQQIGSALGIGIGKRVSKRSVHRFILEQGVGADIQLVYEIIKSGSKCLLQL